MNRLFLRAKHWQLFLPLAGIPLFCTLAIVWKMFLFIQVPEPGSAELMGYFGSVMPYFAGMLAASSLAFFWQWALVTGLQIKLPETLRINTLGFKLILLFPLLYFAGLTLYVFRMMTDIFTNGTVPDLGILIPVIFLEIPAIFCLFAASFISAKNLKKTELQRPVGFSDFITEFLLILFFPIGVWILQPRVNKLFEDPGNPA